MDCEIPGSPYGGPKDWGLAERSVRGFAEILGRNNLLATFFITPECACMHRRVFEQLPPGFELGMHLHPFNIPGSKKLFFLGQFQEAEQRKILKEAKEKWTQIMGKEPTSFRPGNFSANDWTFPLLAELGFSQGSVSAPWRNMPRYYANWEGVVPDPHHVNALSRLTSGNLEFLEVPVTVDPERRTMPGGWSCEFRIEMGDVGHHLLTIKNSLIRFSAEDPEIKALVSITHNTIDYADRVAEEYQVLEGIIPRLQDLADSLNFTLIPTTVFDLHQRVDQVLKRGNEQEK